jgi:hypothetical protein
LPGAAQLSFKMLKALKTFKALNVMNASALTGTCSP